MPLFRGNQLVGLDTNAIVYGHGGRVESNSHSSTADAVLNVQVSKASESMKACTLRVR